MRETREIGYPKHLDPQAQEFWPRNPSPHNHLNLLQPHISMYFTNYLYPFSYPPTGVPITTQVSLTAVTPLHRPPLPPQLAVPTRSLLLSSVPVDVSESTVRKDMEVFGDVRAVQMEQLHEGIVTVHFYDLRHAEAAMVEIQEQYKQQQSGLRRYYDACLYLHLGFEGHCLGNTLVPHPVVPGLISSRAVWAQFTMPKTIVGHNQGKIEIFNLDSEVSAGKLKEVFENFGPVKELREMPLKLKQQQRFVEFFDTRDAAKALSELNGKEIYGKKVTIEFSHPYKYGRRKGDKAGSATVTTKASKNIHTINSRKIYYSRSYDICAPPMPAPLINGGLFHSSSNLPQNQLSKKKSSLSTKENSNWESNGRSNYGSLMTTLPLVDSVKSSKKLYNKHHKLATKEQQKQPRGWPRRDEQKDYSNALFSINEDAIVKSNFSDTRTTVMIKNIPNKYSLKLLLNMLDNHCIQCNKAIAGNDQPLSSYDFVYLPIDFNNKCNVGYGFVNLTSPQATWRLYKAFHLLQWEVFNSRKICVVTYARLQGLEALKQHFKNSKFACAKDDYLPVMFSPPRDGNQLIEPVPIPGHTLPAALIEIRLLDQKSDGNSNDDEDSCNSK